MNTLFLGATGATNLLLRGADPFHFEGPAAILQHQSRLDDAYNHALLMGKIPQNLGFATAFRGPFPIASATNEYRPSLPQGRISIRLFRHGDYAAVSDIHNRVTPERPLSPDEFRFFDENRDPRYKVRRWIAEWGGEIVAYSDYDQPYFLAHPRKFFIRVIVHPEFERRGLGSALYEEVISALTPLKPVLARVLIRSDAAQAIRFFQERGFHVSSRDIVSELDADTVETQRFSSLRQKLESEGIEIRSMRDLSSDPDRDRKLYDLENELLLDAPFPEGHLKMSFESFSRAILRNPRLLQDGYFVALEDGEYVGMSNLIARQVRGDLWTPLTGVKKSHRRRGIALALKLSAISCAKAQGYRFIRTANASTNTSMIGINRTLGFVPVTERLSFIKQFTESQTS